MELVAKRHLVCRTRRGRLSQLFRSGIAHIQVSQEISPPSRSSTNFVWTGLFLWLSPQATRGRTRGSSKFAHATPVELSLARTELLLSPTDLFRPNEIDISRYSDELRVLEHYEAPRRVAQGRVNHEIVGCTHLEMCTSALGAPGRGECSAETTSRQHQRAGIHVSIR